MGILWFDERSSFKTPETLLHITSEGSGSVGLISPSQILQVYSSAGWIFLKPLIILISGKAGVGKSLTAKFFRDGFNEKAKGIDERVMSFAGGVKSTAVARFGWDFKKDGKGRRLLQGIGNIGREYDKDIWIKYLMHYRDTGLDIFPNILIVDDWRFPNELDWFMSRQDEYDIFTIRVVAPKRESLKNTENYNDISETSLKDTDNYNTIIRNNLTKERLDFNCNLLIDNIIKKEMRK